MSLSDMCILVTGSSGTIGNCLSETLLRKGTRVIGVDWKKNIWNKEIESKTINIDLRSQEKVRQLPKDVDLVIHLAANARVYNLVENPDLARDNFLTLYNVLEFCRKNSIKRFLFSSSREVYGNTDGIIHNEEEFLVKNCESSYTATKIGGEALIHAYNQCYGIDFIIVRFSNVYGRYDYSDRVIPLFISKAIKNETLCVFGINKILDFTFIEDAVDGVIKAIESFGSAKNEVYNIATQKGYSLETVAKYIIGVNNSESKIGYGKSRAGEVTKFVADISKAKAILRYQPKYSLEDGIKKTVEWYKPRINNYLQSLEKQKNEEDNLQLVDS